MTALSLIGPSPAASAAAMPSRTRDTGKPTSFIRPNVSSSSASRLTVTRSRPASASASARAREEGSVRRERQVLDAVQRRQARDEALEPAPHERLPAGEPDLPDAERDRRADDALDLVEVQDLRARQERVVRPERLARHAVATAEVAPVGDADAQVAHRALEGVEDGHRGGHGSTIVRQPTNWRRPMSRPSPIATVPPPINATRDARFSHRGRMKPPRPEAEADRAADERARAR